MPRQPRGPIRKRNCSQGKGLVLWYPLCSAESSATTQLDHSGRGTHLATPWTAGQNSLAYMPYPYDGYGLAFGGTGASRTIVDHGVMDSMGGGPITIAFWYRRTASTGTLNPILSCGSTSGGGSGFIAAVAPVTSNVLAYFPGTTGLGDAGGDWVAILSTVIDTTYHIAITGEGSTLAAYVNGRPVSITFTGTGTQAQPPAYTGTRYFGGSGANPRDCIFSDIRVYNRALSGSEVEGLFDPATRFLLWDTTGEDDDEAVTEEDSPVVTSEDCRDIFRPVFRDTFRPVFRGF